MSFFFFESFLSDYRIFIILSVLFSSTEFPLNFHHHKEKSFNYFEDVLLLLFLLIQMIVGNELSFIFFLYSNKIEKWTNLYIIIHRMNMLINFSAHKLFKLLLSCRHKDLIIKWQCIFSFFCNLSYPGCIVNTFCEYNMCQKQNI